MSLSRKLLTAGRIARRQGLAGLIDHYDQKRRAWREQRRYRAWQRIDASLFSKDPVAAREAIKCFKSRPLISVLLPVFNIDEKWLRRCIDSVRLQTYENWELCIADDCSDKSHIRLVLNEYAHLDQRIKVVFRSTNGHISAASNSALELCSGEMCVLLDHDDELSSDALFWVAHELDQYPETQMIYSDEDLLSPQGRRYSPSFKPDFSRDLLYSLNLVTHLCAYRTELLIKIGGFRVGFEGSQDYDLALRVVELIADDQIRHIPRVLYHWRVIRGSVALSGDAKPYAHDRAREAIRQHLQRRGKVASVSATEDNFHRVLYAIPSPNPSVSIILIGTETFRGDEPPPHLRELHRDSHLEILSIDQQLGLANGLNQAARESSGAIMVFLRSALTPIDRDWLDELVRLAAQTEIGCVGGSVINANDEVVAGGLVLGGETIVNTAHLGFPPTALGNMYRNRVIGNFMAVSLSAMAVRRETFECVGGFDAVNLISHFLDADLGLRLHERGFRATHTPYARFRASDEFQLPDEKPSQEEVDYFVDRWCEPLARDPFCNPNLTTDGNFSIKL